MMKHLFSALSILIVGSGCFQKVQYIGRNYPATFNIEMFFSPADVGKDYLIIGKAVGQTITLKRTQRKLISIAKENGADAIIVHVPYAEATNTLRNHVITSTVVPPAGTLQPVAGTVTTISDGYNGAVYADLIKYR